MVRLAIVLLLAAASSAVACDNRNFRGFNDCGPRNFRGGNDVVIERETVIRRGFFGRERSRSSVTRSFR